MAKINLKGKLFTTIDGRVLSLDEYFQDRDFCTDDNGKSFFVKHDALLRTCKELFHIVERSVHICQSPNKNNGLFATATVSYRLNPKYENDNVDDIFFFESSADCHPHNSPPGADKYHTAMAETRASGRALRFLLGVEFCTKEEISDGTREYIDDDPISSNVKNMIEKKFMGQHGIDLGQIRKLLDKTEEEMPDLSVLTVGEGSELVQKLNRNINKLKGD